MRVERYRWKEKKEEMKEEKLHITKLIAVYYNNNLFITYKMGLFRPPIFDALLCFIFRPLISPYYLA